MCNLWTEQLPPLAMGMEMWIKATAMDQEVGAKLEGLDSRTNPDLLDLVEPCARGI